MKWRLYCLVVVIGMTATLSGCAKLEDAVCRQAWQAEEAAARMPGAEGVLVYLQYFQGLPIREQVQKFEEVRATFEETGARYDRVLLASMAILPEKPFTDRALALGLLEGMADSREVEKDGLIGLAQLLESLVSMQRETLVRLSAERQRNLTLIQKLEKMPEMEKQLAEEQQRAGELARQLKELKDIEQILNKRER